MSDLRTFFFGERGIGRAVDGVSFELWRGESLGLVGESGSGKSVTALSLLRLNPQPGSEIVSGAVAFDGTDLLQLPETEMRRFRGGRISMVLQEPRGSLNPSFTIGWQLHEALRLHTNLSGAALEARAIELLEQLRIPNAAAQMTRYPHQFSGGMCQRMLSAIALAGDPEILIADEPTTALDVTTQASYLALLKDLQAERGLAVLFISHDIGVIGVMCDRIAVMYGGHIVETAVTSQLFEQPFHPYTRALLESVPRLDGVGSRLISIEGAPPSIYDDLPGCPFAARCPVVEERCWDTMPRSVAVGDEHSVSCWKFEG